MSLHRRAWLTCDRKGVGGCTETLDLEPTSSQPWRDASERGWTNKTTDQGIETYCPKHTKEK